MESKKLLKFRIKVGRAKATKKPYFYTKTKKNDKFAFVKLIKDNQAYTDILVPDNAVEAVVYCTSYKYNFDNKTIELVLFGVESVKFMD